MTEHTPRIVCSACSRRYGLTVCPTCPVCRGLGTLTLGAAALHHHPADVVARAVELYLTAAAHHAVTTLLLPDRAGHITAAVDELRLAGLLATPEQTPTRADTTPTPTRVAEDTAHALLADLGTHVPTAAIALHHAPRRPLTKGRTRTQPIPVLSADGHPDPIAVIADPIDPLGPSGQALDYARRAREHEAGVITQATPTAATRRARKATP